MFHWKSLRQTFNLPFAIITIERLFGVWEKPKSQINLLILEISIDSLNILSPLIEYSIPLSRYVRSRTNNWWWLTFKLRQLLISLWPLRTCRIFFFNFSFEYHLSTRDIRLYPKHESCFKRYGNNSLNEA